MLWSLAPGQVSPRRPGGDTASYDDVRTAIDEYVEKVPVKEFHGS